MKNLKKPEFIYIGILVIIIFLASYVAFIEIFKSPIEGEILNKTKKIGFIEDVIKKNDYLYYLFNILRGTGMILESAREKTELDKIGAYSITTNLRLQNAVVRYCENTNRASNYTRIEVNCSELDAFGGIPNEKEMNKLIEASNKLENEIIRNLRDSKFELEYESKKLSDLRNLLYILVVVLTGISVFIRYFLDREKR